MDETLTIYEGDPHYGKHALKAWGPFQILENVGQGGFGEVYRAFDTVLQREVALKLLLPRVSSQDDQEKQILREARLLAKVRHPNVVSVYGVDTHEGRVGFWSDFVRGRTLTSVLHMQGPFGPREATLVGIDVCKALAAVHGAGLLHRDIKTSNVMREEGGRILLMDFGLSLDAHDQHALGGTPAYMAPELFANQQASVESDIYAVGVLLYHLLTAKYPVDAPTLPEFQALHQSNKRRSLYEERTDVPDQLVNVIETATRRDPAERFHSAGQMLSALSESLGTGSVHNTGQFAAPPARRGFGWLAAPAVAALLAAVVWFTPLRQSIPFLRYKPVPDNGAHAIYKAAQDALDMYYVPGNLDKAVTGFQQTVEKDPKFALGYGGLCRAYYIQYRNVETPELLNNANGACAKALELDQQLASVHVTLGMLYTLQTNHSLAKQELDAALALDKRNAEVYAALGDLYAKQGRSDDVEPAYQKAMDLAPRDWRWPKQLGDYYRDSGRFDDAVKQYQLAIRYTPENSKVWSNLGIVYRRDSKFPEAEKALRQAIRLDPTVYSYFLNLGAVMVQEGNYPEAVKQFQQASLLNSGDYLTLANLASVYDRIPGDHDQARENYLKAIALAEDERRKKPDDANLLAQLGSYYATIDRADESLPLLRQAAALDPDNPQVLYRAAEGYELLHHRDEALEWIGKALAKKYSLEALKRNPEMAALIADKRFAAIAAKSK